uniref:Phosphatidylethanolamine-binding protein n=1 Tax=Alexandrium catenella TaxID=2925 RepID=A0A7S1RHK1_ALECA
MGDALALFHADAGHQSGNDGLASFLEVHSPEVRPGDPLPGYAYSSSVTGGEDDPLELLADEIPPGSQGFILTARDEDEPPVSGQDPPPPLWAVANISPVDVDSLSTAKSGVTVVPYHGPAPTDDFIHRVYFRLYSTERVVPRDRLQNWGALSRWMGEQKLFSRHYDTGDFSEFLTTAVQHVPKAASEMAVPTAA